MTAFKRIVFCLLFFGSLSFLVGPLNPGFSQWNRLGPMAIMWFLSSLAVPGWHVPIVARIFAFPIVLFLLRGIWQESALIYAGQASISTWDDLWGWVSALFKLFIFTSVLINGRLPESVINPLGLTRPAAG